MMLPVQPVVPMLSLPSVVLFPRALLELRLDGEHFDCASGEWLAEGALWGIATLRHDNGKAMFGDDPVAVFRTVSIGCIVHREVRNHCVRRIVIEGLVRGRIANGGTDMCGPAVEVEILRDHVNVEGPNRKALADTFSEMVRVARQLAGQDSQLRDTIRRVLAAHPHPGVVADLLAHQCISDVYAKHSILAELDVCRRVHLVQIQLAQMVSNRSLQPLRRFR